ncbi:MAG: tetratricopeptide repeat protein [Muribaculaceae bacterium]|nr:tetratricopeptide repeat protein [Muribaculaceae bacterium]
MENENISVDVTARLQALSERLAADADDEMALIERGRLYWALGKRSEAINDYLAAQKINPNGDAKQLLKATYEILDFYNKDLYNP